LNRSTNAIGKISIQLLIPLLFCISVLFLFLQTYIVTIPQAIESERLSAKERLLGELIHMQGTVNNLFGRDNVAAIKQELKLMHIEDPRIRFAAVFDEKNTLFAISHNQYNRHAIESLLQLEESSEFKHVNMLNKPYIYQGEERYQLHGITQIEFPAAHVTLGSVAHGLLLIEYDYSINVDNVRWTITNLWWISLSIAVMLFLVLGYLVYMHLLRQIVMLKEASHQIKSGEYGIELQEGGFKEIQTIIRSFNEMSRTIESDISTITMTQNALRYEKETAQKYLDIVGVMIMLLDKNYNVVMLNRRGCEIIGYESDEVIGKNWIENFLPERFRKKVTHVGDTLTDELQSPVTYFENPVLTKSGEERLIAWRNTTLYDENGKGIGILTSGEDITQMRLAQEELEQSERFFRSIFSSVNEAIFILENNIVVDCNRGAAELFETSKAALVGADMFGTHHIQCKNITLKEFVDEFYSGSPVSTECSISFEEGHPPKIAEVTLSPFGKSKEKIICIARDITRKLEQDKMLKMHTRQAQMGEMISMIAHQWRQPLSTITAITSQVILEQMMAQKQNSVLIDQLRKIDKQVQHLSHTITDFRDFFRPDKPKELTSLSEIISAVLELLDHALKSHSISFECETLQDPEISVYRNEVIQVLMTMVKNSLDAFVENGIEKAKIEVTLEQNESYAVIVFKDNAGGIDEKVINEIFLPYFSTKSQKHGTGLGLYMSKTVIEKHCKGKLDVSSQGDETVFTISLPLEKDQNDV